jgi:hypothetical protein
LVNAPAHHFQHLRLDSRELLLHDLLDYHPIEWWSIQSSYSARLGGD